MSLPNPSRTLLSGSTPQTAYAPYSSEPYHFEGSGGSGGDYYNALEPFFGPSTKRLDSQPADAFPHEAWFLPDAYKGRNDYIRETIVQMVVNFNSFITSEILPWRYQDNPNIAWDSIKFDKTLVDLEPEQGVPRYVTVERESHSDHMVRRGLALIVNHGFAATDGGRKDFMYKVATIAGATQETCDQAGVLALLRSKNQYRHHIVERQATCTNAYDVFQPELWRFGIVQHEERGWYHLDAEAEHCMGLENIQPDTWIVPSRMTAFAAMGQKAETEYYRAGQEARTNLQQGAANFTTFRTKKVFELKPYTLDVDGRTVDPLNRTRMIGDWFLLPYEQQATQVYCCETDRFETFKWYDVKRQFEEGSEDIKHEYEMHNVPVGGVLDSGSGQAGHHGHNESMLDDKAFREWAKLIFGYVIDDVCDLIERGDYDLDTTALAQSVHQFANDVDNGNWNDVYDALMHVSVSFGFRYRGPRAMAPAPPGINRNADRLVGQYPDKIPHVLTNEFNVLCNTIGEIKKQPDQIHRHLPDQYAGLNQLNHLGRVLEASQSNVSNQVMEQFMKNAISHHYAGDVTNEEHAANTWAASVMQRSGAPVAQAMKFINEEGAQYFKNELACSVDVEPEHIDNEIKSYVDTCGGIAGAADHVKSMLFSDASAEQESFLGHMDMFASGAGAYANSFQRRRADSKLAWTPELTANNKTYNFPFKLVSRLSQPVQHLGNPRNICDVLNVDCREVDDVWQKDQLIDVLTFCDSDFRQSRFYKQMQQNVKKMQRELEAGDLKFKIGRHKNFRMAEDTDLKVFLVEEGNLVLTLGDFGTSKYMVCFFALGRGSNTANLFGNQSLQPNSNITMSAPTNATTEAQSCFDADLSVKQGCYLHAGQSSGPGGPSDFQLQVGPIGGPGGPGGGGPGGGGRGGGQGVNNDLICDYLCFRPFRQYTMGSGMLLKKGNDLGNTFRGWADFQLTDNIIAKTHIGHFTFWHASVVTNPKCLFLAEDIFCTNYIGGEGKKILPFAKRHEFKANPIGTMNENRASIIVLPLPVGTMLSNSDQSTLQNVLSLTGKPIDSPVTGKGHYDVGLGNDYEDNMDEAYENAQRVYPGVPVYQVQRAGNQKRIDRIMDHFNHDYNFSGMNTENDYEMDEHYETSNAVINTMTFRTMQKFNRSLYLTTGRGQNHKNEFVVSNLNCGHFGENGVYEGVKRIRCGYLSYFKEMNYQKQLTH